MIDLGGHHHGHPGGRAQAHLPAGILDLVVYLLLQSDGDPDAICIGYGHKIIVRAAAGILARR